MPKVIPCVKGWSLDSNTGTLTPEYVSLTSEPILESGAGGRGHEDEKMDMAPVSSRSF